MKRAWKSYASVLAGFCFVNILGYFFFKVSLSVVLGQLTGVVIVGIILAIISGVKHKFYQDE